MDKHLTWAEVDLNAYAHNIAELKKLTGKGTRLMAVVKADGYGHGAVEIARQALISGAQNIGVARIDEALHLRQAGIDAPILIFGYTPPDMAGALILYDLTQTVYSAATARVMSAIAGRLGKKITVHIKVDSGMGRLGLLLTELAEGDRPDGSSRAAVQEALAISRLPGLTVEGLFTHFATADAVDKSYADRQLEKFLDFADRLGREGLEPPVKHAANSGALIDLPDSHLDMVRPGIATYGLYPSADVNHDNVALKPVMTMKSRIVHLKQVPAGFNVSYGITYQTEKPTTIATVPVGYADGFSRLLSNRGHMLVHGRKVPIVGRICMDLTMLDVGNVPQAKIEDEVVVFGGHGNQAVSADRVAAELNTINYEIVSSVTGRVARVYVKKSS